jgi:uncharacterized protein DUF481
VTTSTRWFVAAIFAIASARATAAYGQGKTDVVTLGNGDRITGEVKGLDRGRLEFSTDDAGTLYLEWDKLTSVIATRQVEVVTTDGRRFLGSLGAAAARSIAVVTLGGAVPLTMSEVALITPIGRSFWKKLDGSVDVGYSYTKSSGISQLNFNSDTIYRKPASQLRLQASLTVTDNADGSGRDDRGIVDMSYIKYPWQRWFLAGAAKFESNESLGLELRSQVGGLAGPRLLSRAHAQMAAGAGLVFNDERGLDVPATQNVEAIFTFRTSYYTYDRPKTNLDISLEYYPSLSDPGRQRLQVDAGVKRELFKDFFASVNGYNTFDSRPPNPASSKNDVGVVVSIGWSY